MRIGFDAKRALNNFTGLGNYSRILITALMRDFPDNDYIVFSPKAKGELFNELQGRFKLFLPGTGKRLFTHSSLWRSSGITNDLLDEGVELYHGLSNELPFNIHRSGIKTVVTIHDVIFLKHKEQYPFIDRQIYNLKTKYAVKHAHKIIAISEETKADLLHFYKVPAEKVEVIYQSANSAFQTSAELNFAKLAKYDLPAKYILNVGSFYPRKNHMRLIDAYSRICQNIEEDLVLVGSEGSMLGEIESLIADKKLTGRVKIISGISNEDLPGVYRNASGFVFPSLYEGFGLPVLEALCCGVPVIASKGGAIEEAGGAGSLFVDPLNVEEMASAMLKILGDASLRKTMIDAGYNHAQGMTDKVFAAKVMGVYKSVLRK